MKIISGKLKGRILDGYNINGTRPTMDRVKESIFSMIQNYINDSIVLDLFSGTGNYGIECYSNGSKYIYLNDYNKECIKVIKNNLNKININEYFNISNLDYMEFLKKNKELKFDLIFLDPPYKMDVVEKIINFIKNNNMLNENGLIICEVTNNNLKDNYDNILLIKNKKYGEKYVFIYKNTI